MKKVSILIALFIGIISLSAQVKFGAKAGVNYNNFGDVKDVATNIVKTEADGKSGYHVGIWVKADLPAVGIYVRPEFVYTQLKASYGNESLEINKIDVPVLIGAKLIGPVHAFAGPAFQFVLDSDYSLENVKGIKTDDFSVGIQLGIGVELGKLGIDVRWERGLSKSETTYSKRIAGEGSALDSFEIDTRPNQIIFGLSYEF
ncbi:MAG: outer membrane beta-barrel protein [Flavobacteriaceae bacterium]|nr:outer membrane beta-barrel protein [Flavobacteriaceae bacterium]